MLMASAPPQAMTAIEASGLKDIASLALGMSISGPGFRSAACVRAPGERRGVCALWDMPNGPKTLLGRIPGDALFAADVNLDLNAEYDAFMNLLQQISPPTYRQAQDAIAQWEKKAGLSLRADILEPIGDEAAAYFRPPLEGVLMVRVKNPQALTKVLLKGLQAACAASPPKCRRGRTEPMSVSFQGAPVAMYLAWPRSTARRAWGSHMAAASSLPASKLLAITSIAMLNMDDAGDIAPAAAMGMMIFYANSAARILHAFASKGIYRKTQAWRAR